MKPRIVKRNGHWFCGGIPGTSPADAYLKWQVWGFVPGGCVPR